MKLNNNNLDNLVHKYYNRYKWNNLVTNFQTPCYFIDKELLLENINLIKKTFLKYFSDNQLYIYIIQLK